MPPGRLARAAPLPRSRSTAATSVFTATWRPSASHFSNGSLVATKAHSSREPSWIFIRNGKAVLNEKPVTTKKAERTSSRSSMRCRAGTGSRFSAATCQGAPGCRTVARTMPSGSSRPSTTQAGSPAPTAPATKSARGLKNLSRPISTSSSRCTTRPRRCICVSRSRSATSTRSMPPRTCCSG